MRSYLRPLAFLLLLTFASLLIHGYHVGVEDQEVYLAAIHKKLDPSLYPVNAVFFTEQMKSSFFIEAVAASVRLTHVRVEWALLAWQLLSNFLVLLGCWQIARLLFRSESARWAGLLLITALMTMPIAGTALFLIDPYLHPRAPATGAILMALAACLEKKWAQTAVWIVVAALMHPLMALFGISMVLFNGVEWPVAKATEAKPKARAAAAGMASVAVLPLLMICVPLLSMAIAPLALRAMAVMLPLGLLHEPSAAWKAATLARTYYFPLQWAWYEWLGLIAPIGLMAWFAQIARRRQMPELARMATRLVMFAALQFSVAALMTMPRCTLAFASLQPMRWLHSFYFLFLLISGGLLAEFALKNKAWRWLLLFVPLAAVMGYVQRDTYSHSDHLEWPGAKPHNAWAQAFLWAGEATPREAVFAIDPNYMSLRAEDAYGMRALARRSLLAENQKDPGAATVFPKLAETWQEQVEAQKGIEKFSREQFHQLHVKYDVSWTVLPVDVAAPLECPYRNERAQVCRVE